MAASAATLLLVTSAPSAADYIRGTSGGDQLVGTARSDTVRAFRGADYVEGRGGSDALLAGPGRDTVVDGRGRDRVRSGPGEDLVLLRRGRDHVFSGPGNDYIEMRHDDGLPDRINCGRGRRDVVQYFGALQARDTYRNCETVQPYEPKVRANALTRR
jgi:Ca2+-binding RTX toxin-like protein